MVAAKSRKWTYPLTGLLLLVLLNTAAHFFYHRFDFTTDQRYTLHPRTRMLLAEIHQPVTVTVFLEGKLPAAFKRLRQATSDLLEDYQRASPARIRVVFADPLEGLDQHSQDTVLRHLYDLGIAPTNLNIKTEDGFTQKTIFPMAMVTAGGRQLPVKLLQNLNAGGSYEETINQSVQNLEYIFSAAIKKVTEGKTPRIGFTEGNGEPDDLHLSDAMKALSDGYEVGRVNLDSITREGMHLLSVLFIVKPQKEFTEAVKYKIDDFVRSGGSIVWSLDQVSADMDSLRGRGEQLAFNHNLNLDDMLFTYGARINYNLVADLNCSEIPVALGGGQQRDIQLVPWVYYPVLVTDAALPLVKNIDGIRTEFLSTVDTIGVKGIRKTVLLQTSGYHILYNTPKLLSLQSIAETPDQRLYAHAPAPVAVLLEGSFPSVFLNRQVPAGLSREYRTTGRGKPARMVVIGDGDVFRNQVSSRDGSVFPLGFDRYTQKNFGNRALLLNLADYLSSADNLIVLRNKELRVRLLDKQLLKKERTKWQVVNVLFPLLLLVLFAIFQHYYRKYKYAR